MKYDLLIILLFRCNFFLLRYQVVFDRLGFFLFYRIYIFPKVVLRCVADCSAQQCVKVCLFLLLGCLRNSYAYRAGRRGRIRALHKFARHARRVASAIFAGT